MKAKPKAKARRRGKGYKKPKELKLFPSMVKRHVKGPRKERATTGQSGPRVHMPVGALNDHEQKLLAEISGSKKEGPREPRKISELARECFAGKGTGADTIGNSMVRNALRRLVCGGLVEKGARGAYRVTESGRRRYHAFKAGDEKEQKPAKVRRKPRLARKNRARARAANGAAKPARPIDVKTRAQQRAVVDEDIGEPPRLSEADAEALARSVEE